MSRRIVARTATSHCHLINAFFLIPFLWYCDDCLSTKVKLEKCVKQCAVFREDQVPFTRIKVFYTTRNLKKLKTC